MSKTVDQPKPNLLFTPGPLNTSPSVRQAMLTDMGSRDDAFIRLIADVRQAILKVAGVEPDDGYEAIPIQGSGTYAVEAVLSTAVGPRDRVLFLVNGAYGRRMVEIADCHGLTYEVCETAENEVPGTAQVESILGGSSFTHLAAVHCETTTGILNPIARWGAMARQHHCQFIVDAMSSFGAIPIDLARSAIDYLISSANKCLQGVPGLAFAIARRDRLMGIGHRPRTVSLDLRQQLVGLEKNGQFRFTPPTHVLLALSQALRELEEEGGVAGRGERYRQNHRLLVEGMRGLGFRELAPTELQSYIITAFLYPESPNFRFDEFYARLASRGMLIYPGKLARVDCFRIGNIGHLFASDIQALLRVIESTLIEMQVEMPAQFSPAASQAGHK